jgi:predicted MPP superfamily phosphohydrolase
MNRMPTVLLVLLAGVGHVLLWTGVINRLHGWAGPKWLIDLLTALSFALLAAIPLAWLAHLVPPSYVHACAALGAVGLVSKLLWIEPRRYDRSVQTQWEQHVQHVEPLPAVPMAHGPFASLLCKIPYNEALSLAIDTKQLVLPNLPASLVGLRLVHISDLHMTGRITRPYYEFLVRQVNQLQPDVICITGDIIENSRCLPWLRDPLGQLQSRLGTYYVLGNHDAYIDMAATRRALAENGFCDLSGRWLETRWDNTPVALGGNELPWIDAAPPAPNSMSNSQPNQPGHSRPAHADSPHARQTATPPFRLVLCHTPDQFGWCCRVNADLALAGHTHGGQIQFPLFGPLACPSLFGTRYACGLFQRQSTVLHVTRGISGKTPLRMRCRPEIAVLRLTAKDRTT